jgi:hypothetical protein
MQKYTILQPMYTPVLQNRSECIGVKSVHAYTLNEHTLMLFVYITAITPNFIII